MPSNRAAERGEWRSVSRSTDRPASMNGPLPMGACPNVPEPAAERAGTIDSVGEASADGSDDHGEVNEMWTTPGDGTETADTIDNKSAPLAPAKPWATRSNENFTS